MKIYIVTKGEYSSYRISKVFLTKKKAEEYAKYNSSVWDNASVEVYETDYDNFQVKNGYIKCELHFKVSMYKALNLETSQNEWHINTFFDENDYTNTAEYVYLKKEFDDLIFENEPSEEEPGTINYEFTLIKYFKEFEDVTKNTPEKCKRMLAKIGCDICAEITYYMKVVGYDSDQITEIMRSKYKHGIDTDEIEEEKD